VGVKAGGVRARGSTPKKRLPLPPGGGSGTCPVGEKSVRRDPCRKDKMKPGGGGAEAKTGLNRKKFGPGPLKCGTKQSWEEGRNIGGRGPGVGGPRGR